MLPKVDKPRLSVVLPGPSNTGRKTPSEIPQDSSDYLPYPVGSVWGTCSPLRGGQVSREVVILEVRRFAGTVNAEGGLVICFQYLPTPYFPSNEISRVHASSFSKRFFFDREAL